MLASLRSLDPLVRALTTPGYRVVGPTVRDGAIVLAGLDSAEALPYGWGATTSAGGDGGYARRRAGLFIVAVSCTEPAATCFCASTGCVGRGRCIAWCPVGIDITAGVSALAGAGLAAEPEEIEES